MSVQSPIISRVSQGHQAGLRSVCSFWRNNTAFHCPRETPRVEEADMGVMSPRHDREMLYPTSPFLFHNKIAIQWYCKPPSALQVYTYITG